MNTRKVMKQILIVVLSFVLVYSVVRVAPVIVNTNRISNMSDTQVIEYVLSISDEEYVDLLKSITKKQALRVLDLMLAYNINALSQADMFTF